MGSRDTPIHECVSACRDDEAGMLSLGVRWRSRLSRWSGRSLWRCGRPVDRLEQPSDALQSGRTTAPRPLTVVRVAGGPRSTCAWLFRGVGQDRRQANADASWVDPAKGLVLSSVSCAPRTSFCHRVTMRGSTGARGDRSAEGTNVA